MASAAVVPTAFQYSNGWPIRFEISISPSDAGQTRARSAYVTAAMAASRIPLMTAGPAFGASRAPATPAAKTPR